MRPYKVESRTLLFKTKEGVLLMETEKNGQKGKTDTDWERKRTWKSTKDTSAERSTVTNSPKATKRRDHFDKQVPETTGDAASVEQWGQRPNYSQEATEWVVKSNYSTSVVEKKSHLRKRVVKRGKHNHRRVFSSFKLGKTWVCLYTENKEVSVRQEVKNRTQKRWWNRVSEEEKGMGMGGGLNQCSLNK